MINLEISFRIPLGPLVLQNHAYINSLKPQNTDKNMILNIAYFLVLKDLAISFRLVDVMSRALHLYLLPKSEKESKYEIMNFKIYKKI